MADHSEKCNSVREFANSPGVEGKVIEIVDEQIEPCQETKADLFLNVKERIEKKYVTQPEPKHDTQEIYDQYVEIFRNGKDLYKLEVEARNAQANLSSETEFLACMQKLCLEAISDAEARDSAEHVVCE